MTVQRSVRTLSVLVAGVFGALICMAGIDTVEAKKGIGKLGANIVAAGARAATKKKNSEAGQQGEVQDDDTPTQNVFTPKQKSAGPKPGQSPFDDETAAAAAAAIQRSKAQMADAPMTSDSVPEHGAGLSASTCVAGCGEAPKGRQARTIPTTSRGVLKKSTSTL
jgi:hypothetical protein